MQKRIVDEENSVCGSFFVLLRGQKKNKSDNVIIIM